MKKTTLLLSLVTSLLLAETVKLNDLAISSSYEQTTFSSNEVEYKPEIATTLPSNMLLTADYKGFQVDGATADFTSIYWNGIEVIDPSATNNYPTLMNYGRSASSVVSIDGSKINYKTQEENSIEVEGGYPRFARVHAATTIHSENSSNTLRLDGIHTKLNSAYTNTRSFNPDEEKDLSQTYDISYIGDFSFAENYSSKVALLHKKVDYDYDSYNDANDTTPSFDSTLNIVGVDAGYDADENELKIDLQETTSLRNDMDSNDTFSSKVDRIGLKGAYSFSDFTFKASSHYVKESAEIYTEKHSRNYLNLNGAFIYDSKYANINASAKKSYKDTYSTQLSTKVPLSAGISALAKAENNGVNPTIYQENKGKWTIANKALKSQKLKKYVAGLEYSSENKNILLRVTYSKINTDDMITYGFNQEHNASQYQNIDNTEYDFIHAEALVKFLEYFTFSEDYSNIRNMSSSNKSLVYNLPKHRSVTKLIFEGKSFSAYYLLNYTSLLHTYSGNTEPSYISNAGIGYKVNKELEIHVDIYNISNEYYEYNANYPQTPRLITATLKYNF